MNNTKNIIALTPMDALDHLVLINLETTIWAGRRKMTSEDFGGIDLPPADLASLGSKKICDPAKVAVFNKLKARAVALLDKHAVRFLGGWAIPEAKVQEILDGLNQIKTDFYNEKQAFLSDYDSAIAEWLDKHETWREMIANSIASPAYVNERLQFCWQLFKVKMSDNMPDTSLADSVSNLGDELFAEIAKDASETWRDVFAGKMEVTHKALSPLQTLRNKLSGLSFVSVYAQPVVEIIDTALKTIPPRGKHIGGSHLVMLQGLVCLLKDKNALLQQAQTVLNTRSANSKISDILSGFAEAKQKTSAPKPVSPASLDSCGLW